MKLVANGTAYYAFDTAEELDAMRARQQHAGIAPKYDRSSMRNQYTLGELETARLLDENAAHVIRLKVPLQQDIRFNDLIRGEVVVNGREIDDQILLKSDGFPTYHLANVVDDHFMEITHVIRAEEWLPSTPKHIILYQAFGWEPPTFAHVPLLLNPDRSKMSKRHGDVMVRDFATKGFFPDALVNFVALCGWNPGTDNEFFSMQELIDAFTLERVNKAGAIFDYQKLNWMNGEYLKNRNVHDLARELHPMLIERGYAYIDAGYVADVIELVRERVAFLADITEFADYLFGDTLVPLTPEAQEVLAKVSTLKTALQTFRNGLDADVLASQDAFKGLAQTAADAAGVKQGSLMKPLRLVLTHREVGADLFRTLQLIGVDRCLQRLDTYLAQ
jgi:glutamyl-tRNA synthetase